MTDYLATPLTIYQSCIYLHWMELLFGTSAFCNYNGRLILSTCTRAYALTIAATCCSISMMTTTKLASDPQNNQQLDNAMVLVLMVMAVILAIATYLFVVLQTQRKAHQIIQLYARLDALDRVLLRVFHAPLKYAQLRRKHLLLCCFKLTFYTAYVLLPLGLVQRRKNLLIVLLGQWCYATIISGTATHSYSHINFVQLLRIRALLFQQLLSRHHYTNKRLIMIFSNLQDMIDDVNSIYAANLCWMATHDFALITIGLFACFTRALDSKSRFLLVYYYAYSMFAALIRLITCTFNCKRTTIDVTS